MRDKVEIECECGFTGDVKAYPTYDTAIVEGVCPDCDLSYYPRIAD